MCWVACSRESSELGKRVAHNLSASVLVIRPHCAVSSGNLSSSRPDDFNNSN